MELKKQYVRGQGGLCRYWYWSRLQYVYGLLLQLHFSILFTQYVRDLEFDYKGQLLSILTENKLILWSLVKTTH